MHRLKLFGGVSLAGEDGPLTGPPARRHRLALLSLLAAAHPGGLSREKLLTYLWPERDAEHGRNLLNQAVHALRRALGAGAILSSGDELRLDARALHCDVIAFQQALVAGEREQAAQLYAGPFLDGFYLPDAPEFEHWVNGERKRLARAYAMALEQLAEGAAARRDVTSAVDWWRRLAEEDPYSGRVTIRLMEALEATADRAGAIQQARTHATLLEQEFGAEPDPEVTSFAERLRRATANLPTSAGEGSSSARSPSVSLPPGAGNGGRASPEPVPPLQYRRFHLPPSAASPGESSRRRASRSSALPPSFSRAGSFQDRIRSWARSRRHPQRPPGRSPCFPSRTSPAGRRMRLSPTESIAT